MVLIGENWYSDLFWFYIIVSLINMLLTEITTLEINLFGFIVIFVIYYYLVYVKLKTTDKEKTIEI